MKVDLAHRLLRRRRVRATSLHHSTRSPLQRHQAGTVLQLACTNAAQPRHQTCSVLQRQRAFMQRLFGDRLALLWLSPLERVLRKSILLQQSGARSWNFWWSQPLLQAGVERVLRIERSTLATRVLRQQPTLFHRSMAPMPRQLTLRTARSPGLLRSTTTTPWMPFAIACTPLHAHAPTPQQPAAPWLTQRPAAPVPMTVLTPAGRNAAAPAVRDRDAPVARESQPLRAPAFMGLPAMQQQALPAHELTRVTDQGLRQLEQRSLSWRERTGRA